MTDLDGRLGARRIQGARDYQEDDFGISQVHSLVEFGEHILLVLADGMGGHVAGGTASGMAVLSFVQAYQDAEGSNSERLMFALEAANAELAEAIKTNPEWDGMGCTLVGVAITGEGMKWVSVGDSPLWILHNGELERLNADHSMAPVIANLVETGHMTPEEAARDKRKNALRSAVMGDEMELIDLREEPFAISPTDRILLASDGLDTLSAEEITKIMNANADNTAQQAVDALIAGVVNKAKPGQDNTTVLIFEPGETLKSKEISVRREDVESIVRRAKGMDDERDTRPGRGGKKSAADKTSKGMMLVIILLLAAILAALLWLKLSPVGPESQGGESLGTTTGDPEPGEEKEAPAGEKEPDPQLETPDPLKVEPPKEDPRNTESKPKDPSPLPEIVPHPRVDPDPKRIEPLMPSGEEELPPGNKAQPGAALPDEPAKDPEKEAEKTAPPLIGEQPVVEGGEGGELTPAEKAGEEGKAQPLEGEKPKEGAEKDPEKEKKKDKDDPPELISGVGSRSLPVKDDGSR